MRAMDVGVTAAASPQCKVPLQARLELVNAIGQLHVRLCLLAAASGLHPCTNSMAVGSQCRHLRQAEGLLVAIQLCSALHPAWPA